MLTFPIKKKWFDQIISGIKKEEYRSVSPYYDTRFTKLLGFPKSEMEDVKEMLRRGTTQKEFVLKLRNGYSANSPYALVSFTLSIGEGKEEWGAEQGEEYYRMHIKKVIAAAGNIAVPYQKVEGN